MKEQLSLEERYAGAHVSRFERLPLGVIKDVTVNEQMRENVADPHLLQWLDEDYLAENAAAFSIGAPLPFDQDENLDRSDNDTYPWSPLPQTPTSHRAVYFKKDASFTDEYGNVYGEIGAKGTGLSHRDERISRNRDPLGLFGHDHAIQDMEISNLFASYGGRTSRALGVIELEPDALDKWAFDHPLKSKGYDLSSELNKLLKNTGASGDADKPALIVRLMGTDRVSDANNYGHFSTSRVISRAARLLHREMEGRGYQQFLEHYSLPSGMELAEPMARLGWMTQWEKRSFLREKNFPDKFHDGYHDSLESFAFLYAYLTLWNQAIFKNISREHFNGGLSYKGDKQDIDLTGVWNDWETSIEGTPQYSEQSRRSYIKNPWIIPEDIFESSVQLATDAANMAGLDHKLPMFL